MSQLAGSVAGMISTIAIENYRSLRDVVLELGDLTVITGANGTGKSSLYRALRLLADCGSGEVIGSLARTGGLASVLWAGPEHISSAMRRGEVPIQGTGSRKKSISLQMGFAAEDFGYQVDLGLPKPEGGSFASMFLSDPEIKREIIFSGPVMRPATSTVRRRHGLVEVRDGRSWQEAARTLPPHRSILFELSDPQRTPEVLAVRERIRGWRFYDSFRTDADAPARRPRVGTRTPVLDHDGADLAAALQTIMENGDGARLQVTVADAFDGAELRVTSQGGLFDVALTQPGLLRPLSGAELSDGTLRYLLLAAALLSPRLPGLLVLNEPETSLHPDVLPALGRLIADTSRHTQVVVVSHSRTLIEHLGRSGSEVDTAAYELVKELGQTRIADQLMFDRPAWNWGSR